MPKRRLAALLGSSAMMCCLGLILALSLTESPISARVSASPVKQTGVAKPPVMGADSNALSQPGAATPNRILADYGKLPLTFEANQGQVDPQVKFLTRGHGYTLFLTGDAAVLTLRAAHRPEPGRTTPSTPERDPAVLRMQLVHANPSARVSGLEPQAGRSNYFIGNDPQKWRKNVPPTPGWRTRESIPE